VQKPPTVATLIWQHALVFDATSGSTSLRLDGDSREGPSPVQALAMSLAGCMSTDVAHVLQKGRHAFEAIRSEILAERAQSDPHRFLRVTVRFVVTGPVPREAVERAVALSRDRYCSVWHSMREDIELTTICDVG
jgi:putative redox protein